MFVYKYYYNRIVINQLVQQHHCCSTDEISHPVSTSLVFLNQFSLLAKNYFSGGFAILKFLRCRILTF